MLGKRTLPVKSSPEGDGRGFKVPALNPPRPEGRE